MAHPPPLLTSSDPVMDALLLNNEQGDDDYILLHYIKHVKIAIAGYFAITALSNMPSSDIARTRLVWQNHFDELIYECPKSLKRYLFDGAAIGAASCLLD